MILLILLTLLIGCKEKSQFNILLSSQVEVIPATVSNKYFVSNWNKYVQASNTSLACTGAETGSYLACIHAGDKRQVTVPNTTSCSGLIAEDSLGVFDFDCQNVASTVVFTSRIKSSSTLASLINFNDNTFKPISVSIYKNGNLYAQTSSSTWWSNPIATMPDSSSALQTLATVGTIYLLKNNVNTYGFNINADEISIVVSPAVKIFAAMTGNNCSNATGESAGADSKCIISAGTQKFLWIEGFFDGASLVSAGQFRSIHFYSVTHSVVNKSSLANNVTTNSSAIALSVIGASFNNLFNNINLANVSYAITLNNTSRYNRFSNIIGVNTSQPVISLYSTASYNSITSVNCINVGTGSAACVYIATSNNFLSRISVINSGNGVTFANGATQNMLFNLMVINVNISGVYALAGGNQNYIINLAISHANAPNLQIDSNNNEFYGYMLVGNSATNCFVLGTGNNLTSISCVPGNANYVLSSSSLNLTNSIVGKVTTADTANTTAGNPSTAFSLSFDWLNFENKNRGWGRDGSAFPNSDHRDVCAVGNCRVWDTSLRATDVQIREKTGDGSTLNSSFASGGNCPVEVDGSRTFTINSYTFLKNAIENVTEGGNGNGLCETGERCTYMPNFGQYQGHGTLAECIFNPGTLTGITMFGYPTNGR